MRRRDPFGFLARVFQYRSVRPSQPAEVDEEIDYHLDRTQEQLVEGGMSRSQARREAERRFGDLAHHRAELNRLNRGRGRGERFRLMIDALRATGAAAGRSLRGNPAVTATVVLTLALGIGANATMFGVIDRLILRAPPHIDDAGSVVRIYVQRAFIDRVVTTESLAHPDVTDLLAAQSFSRVAAYGGARVTVGSGDDAERVSGARAEPGFFPLLGVEPLYGRFYQAEEDVVGNATVAVLGYDYWSRRFGGDPGVIGSRIELGGVPHQIVGVAPEGFTGVNLRRIDIWVPLRAPVNRTDPAMWEGSRGWYFLRAVARLAPGVSIEQAAAEATALHRAGRLAGQTDNDYYESSYDPEARVVPAPVIAAQGPQRSDESVVARWLTGVSGIVLLIACANVANILLAVGSARRREVGVRLALGISSRRLVAGLLAESLMLAALGGIAAVAVAQWGSGLIRALLLPEVHWASPSVDSRVLLFTAAATLVTGLLAGLIPALSAARLDVTRVLAGGSRGGALQRSRARTTMLVLQTTLSVVLLVGAGLFVRSLQQVRAIDLGFETEGLVIVSPEIDRQVLTEDLLPQFYDRALQRLSTAPGVLSAAASSSAPFYSSFAVPLEIPDVPEPPRFSDGGPYVTAVQGDYFAAMGIRVVRGRGFGDSDVLGAPPVAVVDEAMARAYWPDGDAVGKCLRIGEDEACSTIVGVAEATAGQALLPEDTAHYYVPIAQHEAWNPDVLVARLAPGASEALAPALARSVRTAADGVRFVQVRPFDDLIDPQARSWTLGASLFSAFGLLALVIAAVGLYAVLAFNVSQRTHEIGVRAALGATPLAVTRLVVGQATRLVAASLTAGIAAALVSGRWLEPLLYGVRPTDTGVLAAVVGVLFVVGVIAALVPAQRAARVDPVTALRAD